MIRFPKKLTKDGFRRSSTLHPVFLSVKNEAIPCSMASMILPEGENLAYRDFVRLYTADGDMGVYMVTAPSNTYPGNPSITLCHAVCLLDDVRIRGSGTLSGSFGEVVRLILQQQTDESPLFTAGDFAESDITIRVEYNNDTLLSLLKAACTRAYDQQLTIDQTGNPWVLGSVSVPTTPTAEGRFTRNLQSVSIDTDGDDQCTRLVVEHTNWSSGEKTYTIHDADSISQYGVIEDVWSVPYGATEEDANAYIAELLRQRGEPTVSIDIDGYDLHTATGESLDEFATGDLMRCCLPEYNTTVNARITTVEYPDVYGSPDARRVSLRNKTQTLSDLLIEIKKEARRAGGGAGRAASAAAAANWRLNLTYDELTDLGDYYRALHNEVGIFADATEATLTEYATSIEMLYTDTEQLQQTTTSAWERIDGMEGSITLHAERITDLSYEQEGIIAEIKVQSDQIALKASKENLDKLSDDFTSLSADVTVAYDNIRLAVHEGDEVLSSLKLTIDGLENWQTDAAGNISELINDVRGLSSVVTAADGRVGRLVNTADGLTSSVGLQGEIMAEFRTRLDEISADVRDANGNFASLAVLSDSVAANVRNAEGKIGALSVTADDIRAAISAQSGAMSSLQVTLEQISNRVQDANGAVGGFTVEAERIAGVLTDATGKINSLVEQTNDRFSALVGDINTVRGQVSTVTGSALWMTRNDIVSAVGNMYVKDGKIHIKDGSGLVIDRGSASFGVYDSDSLTAGIIASKLNGGTVKVKAAVIELDGYVTAAQLQTEIAKIDNLVSGATEAKKLKASTIDCVSLLRVKGTDTTWRSGDFVTGVTFPAYKEVNLYYTDWDGEKKSQLVLTPTKKTAGSVSKSRDYQYLGTSD